MKRERYCDPFFLVVSFVFWYFPLHILLEQPVSDHSTSLRSGLWFGRSDTVYVIFSVWAWTEIYFCILDIFLDFDWFNLRCFIHTQFNWAPSKLQVEKKPKVCCDYLVCKSFWCWQLQWVCWVGRADIRSRPGLCTQDVLSKPNLGSSRFHFNGSSSQDGQAFVIAADSSDSMPSLRFLCMGRTTHPLLNWWCGRWPGVH